jgi:hypothetical protein
MRAVTTVRGKLNALLEALGYPGEAGEQAAATSAGDLRLRKEVLDAVNRGDLSVDEALRRLRKD